MTMVMSYNAKAEYQQDKAVWILGMLAVVKGKGGYRVVHTPTGLNMGFTTLLRQAKEAMRAIETHVGSDPLWKSTTPEKVRDARNLRRMHGAVFLYANRDQVASKILETLGL